MIRKYMLSLLVAPLALSCMALVGCNSSPAKSKAELTAEAVTAGLAELSEDDRRMALAQKYCPVKQQNLLGSMGKPFKIMISGQTVFLCCPDCKNDADKDPKATLAKVAEFKRNNAPAK